MRCTHDYLATQSQELGHAQDNEIIQRSYWKVQEGKRAGAAVGVNS